MGPDSCHGCLESTLHPGARGSVVRTGSDTVSLNDALSAVSECTAASDMLLACEAGQQEDIEDRHCAACVVGELQVAQSCEVGELSAAFVAMGA